MLFIPMFSLMFLSTWGKKTFATPIIAAGEKPNPSAPFITFGLAGVAVDEVVGRQKFVICEEGIAVGYIFGFLLTRWNRIKSFTPKRNRQQFVLKLGSVGRQIIYCQNTFDQVQLLLTQHVPVST